MIIPLCSFRYPASLSFIRRLLFVPSLSLPNVRVLVGRWLAVERDEMIIKQDRYCSMVTGHADESRTDIRNMDTLIYT